LKPGFIKKIWLVLPKLKLIQIKIFFDLYALPKNENDNYPLNGKFPKKFNE